MSTYDHKRRGDFFKEGDQICHSTGKIGNLDVHFPEKEITGDLPKHIKNVFYIGTLPPT